MPMIAKGGAVFSFEIENNEQIKALLKKAGDKGKDLRIPLKRAGILMVGSIDKNFRAEGRPDKWTPLSDMTLAMRRKHGKGAKILQDTGRGKGSMAYKVISNKQVEIGTDVGYMATHQTGKTIRLGKRTIRIPQRKFLLFQSEDDKNIVKIFTEYLGEIIR